MPAEEPPPRPELAVEDARQITRLLRRGGLGPVDATDVSGSHQESFAGAHDGQGLPLRHVDGQGGGAIGGHAEDAPFAAGAHVGSPFVVDRHRGEVPVADREHLLHAPVAVDAVEGGLGLALSGARQRASGGRRARGRHRHLGAARGRGRWPEQRASPSARSR